MINRNAYILHLLYINFNTFPTFYFLNFIFSLSYSSLFFLSRKRVSENEIMNPDKTIINGCKCVDARTSFDRFSNSFHIGMYIKNFFSALQHARSKHLCANSRELVFGDLPMTFWLTRRTCWWLCDSTSHLQLDTFFMAFDRCSSVS